MKILYQIPSLESVYAGKFIYEGYKNAFTDLRHEFRALTSNDNLRDTLKMYNPDIFFYSLNSYALKFLDLNELKKWRKKGLIVFCQIRAWNDIGTRNKPLTISGPLKYDIQQISMIKNGLAGDIFWHWFDEESPYMEGFTKKTGYKFNSILLAADKTRYFYDYDKKFASDICYVGSYLPSKRDFIKKNILPLTKWNSVKIYGSDWTLSNRVLGYIQKAGQYFNIDMLKKIRGLDLSLEDERKIYSSSTISLNVHEDYVRKYNLEINERTFKVIASGGFEIADNVKVLRKYFTKDELVIGESGDDWLDKIRFYLKSPEKRQKIIDAGIKKVLAKHTYHNRVNEIIGLYEKLK